MRHRPGITLIEVLAAIFVMGIGLLALLVLFPVGALSMARAIRDDRAAAAGANAAALANAFDVRNDPAAVGPGINQTVNYSYYLPTTTTSVGSTLYIDPYYAAFSNTLGAGAGSTGMPRYGVSYVKNPPADLTRYFSFQDEIVFANLGIPDSSTGLVDRPCTYTYAYLLRRYSTSPTNTTNADTELSVVVYAGRSLQVQSGETIYAVSQGNQNSNSLTLAYAAGNPPNIRKGDWVLDVTTPTAGAAANGYFYRVDGVNNPSNTSMTLQLEMPLKQSVTTLVAMQNVITVIDRGVAWRP